MATPLIDPALFDQLKAKIEEDTDIRKGLDQILDDLNQHVSSTQGLQTRIHSTPRSKCRSRDSHHLSTWSMKLTLE